MITLTIINLKTKESSIKVFTSPVKAERCIEKLILDAEEAKKLKKGDYLEGFSYDTSGEKETIIRHLPQNRKFEEWEDKK